MRKPTIYFGALLASCLIACASARADGPPGGTIVDQTRTHYQQVRQYASTTGFHATTYRGRWVASDAATTRVAFDRASQRLKVDAPDYLLVCDGKKVWIKMPSRFPGQHMELDQPAGLDYDALVKQAPMLAMLPLPDVVFLLSDDPIKVLSEGTALTATPGVAAPGDPDPRPFMQAQTHLGPMKLVMNPQTGLIERMSLGESEAGGDRVEVTLDITVDTLNQPLPDDAFAFDTTGSTAVASFTPPAPGGGGAGQAGGGQGPLIGQRAPDFTLQDIHGKEWSLKDATADIVVLGFWASWAPPCEPYIPALQKLQDRAKENGVSVQVVMINCGEEAPAIAELWKASKLSTVCVVDDFSVSDQYQMTVLPHTVIIAEGVVRYVHSGPEEDYTTLFSAQIEKMLGEIKAKQADESPAKPDASSKKQDAAPGPPDPRTKEAKP